MVSSTRRMEVASEHIVYVQQGPVYTFDIPWRPSSSAFFKTYMLTAPTMPGVSSSSAISMYKPGLALFVGTPSSSAAAMGRFRFIGLLPSNSLFLEPHSSLYSPCDASALNWLLAQLFSARRRRHEITLLL